MNKILNDIYFDHGYNCFFASLYNVLRYFGCSLHEEDMFLLQKEYIFLYDRKHRGSLPADSFVYQNYNDSSEWLADQFGLSCQKMSMFDNDIILKALTHNSPVILMVKSQILSYTSRIYHPTNARELHCIVLYGLDNDRGNAYIADCYDVDNNTNIRCYTGLFPLSTLKQYTFGGIWIQPGSCRDIAEEVILRKLKDKLDYFIYEPGDERYASGKRALLACIEDNLITIKINNKLLAEFYLELSYLIKAHFLCFLLYVRMKIQRIHALTRFSQPIWTMRNQWNSYCMKLWKASMNSQILTPLFFLNKAQVLFEQQDVLFKEISHALSILIGGK